MLRRTVLTDNGFPKRSRAQVVISLTEWCRFFMQCHLRDRRSLQFNVGFRPCPLRTEISPDSLYLLMILWTVDGEIPRFFAIVRWETLFLNCWTISARSFSLNGDPLPIMACEQLSLSWMLFLYPIMTHTCFQLGHLPMERSKQVWNVPNRCFFGSFLNFPSLFLPLPQLFWNLLLASNSDFVYIYTKTTNFFNLSMKYLVFVLYAIEYRSKKVLQMITLYFI